MAKVNISLPDELLAWIDAEAKQLDMSRSGLIQEASARYIVAVRDDRSTEVRRLRILAAQKRMKEIGARMGFTGDEDTVQLVHDARDEAERELERKLRGE
ncbi:MAG: ribbon-helix-helix protein, CopG family [Coriobacteriia bacterium]|jgi:metal-responsive CopG/Arc/MetJ family transcriptional regulator|nr:ribbon-helix-helix protein, CopG family [Coriobacteriia bacterium]